MHFFFIRFTSDIPNLTQPLSMALIASSGVIWPTTSANASGPPVSKPTGKSLLLA